MDNGYRIYGVMGENFEMPKEYTVVDFLGQGAYGCVCAVRDSSSSTLVAVKKCKSIFQSRTLAKRTLREVRLLRLLVHPNIVRLRKVIQPRFEKTFSSLYLVFDLMETDLASIIRSTQPLSDRHVQYFTLQLLRGCKHMHENMVCHRDIKPRNILVNGDCTLKVADFGLSRVHSSVEKKTSAMTDYVSTRWYRAPEILCGDGRGYDFGIDLWAVGCCMAELVGRVPLFPGADAMKQIDLIVGALGKPPSVFIEQLRKPTAKALFESLPSEPHTRRQVSDMIHSATSAYRSDFKVTPGPGGVSNDALVLIDRLLQYDSKQRPTAQDCLSSPYFAGEQLDFPDSPDLTVESKSEEEEDGGPGSSKLNNPAPKVRHISEYDITKEFFFESSRLTFDMLRKELLKEATAYDESKPCLASKLHGESTEAKVYDHEDSAFANQLPDCIYASGTSMNTESKQLPEKSRSARFNICGPPPSPVQTQLTDRKVDVQIAEQPQGDNSLGDDKAGGWCSIQ